MYSLELSSKSEVRSSAAALHKRNSQTQAPGAPRMEQYGNQSTYNVESVLRKNIVDSEYFRDTCGKLGTWSEVVDQIYYDVQSVEPWMSGNARGASTAFCLLYRSVSHFGCSLHDVKEAG